MEHEIPQAFDAVLQELLAIKRTDGDQASIDPLSKAGALKILEFRALHRRICEDTEEASEKTSDAKTQLDQFSLQLQNLLYEKQHYEKEISSCRTFKSAYTEEQLELLSEAEFNAARPAAPDGDARDDPHQLMLDKLQHELTFRQQTVQELEALKSKRDALAADVAQKRSSIAALESEVGKLREAAQAVQQQLEMQTTAAV